MGGPWEEYAAKPAASGPWEEYKTPAATTPQRQDPALIRFGSSLASGAGVVSPQQGKDFFRHPIDTAKGMLQSQADLGKRAYSELRSGDISSGLTHGVEYMLPGVGPNLAQAGDQINKGDVAGGIGRTIGTALPIVAGSPEARAVPGKIGPSIVRGVARGVNTALEKAPGSLGAATGAAIGHATGIPQAGELGGIAGYAMGKELLPKLRVPGENFGLPKPVVGSMVKSVEEPAVATPQPAGLKGVEPALEESLGAKKLEPNVPLKDQLTKVPEHLGQFARTNGMEMDQALNASQKAKVQALTNVQVRQLAINMGEDMGQDVIGRAKLSGAVARPEIFQRLLKDHSPAEIVKAIEQGKHLPTREAQ